MADDKPRPKPGSLRDRIAAFEAKPADTPPPPAPRPKPGHVQWKPRAASPPSSPPRTVKSADVGTGTGAAEGGSGSSGDVPSPERKYGGRGGMSATDAKEVIGGSLKERMAALQGRGAFGAPAPAPPPPRPAGDRPKWKPPVQPVHSPDHEEGAHAHSEGSHVKAEAGDGEEHSRLTTAEHAEGEAHHDAAGGDEADQPAEQDDEEEERKRRAAIAARMARLGGARFGMGAPPMFAAPKPQPKSAHSETSDVGSVHSPPAADDRDKASLGENAAEGGDDSLRDTLSKHGAASSQVSLASLESGTSATTRAKSPASMPAPAAPRRAGPPRRRAPKSPDAELPALPTVDAALEEESATPLSAEQRDETKLEGDDNAEEAEHAHEPEPEPEPVPEDETEEEAAARRKRIAERLAKSGGFNPFAPRPPTPPEAEAEAEEADVAESAATVVASGEAEATEAEVPHEGHEEADEDGETYPAKDVSSKKGAESLHETEQDTAEAENDDEHAGHVHVEGQEPVLSSKTPKDEADHGEPDEGEHREEQTANIKDQDDEEEEDDKVTGKHNK